MSLVVAVEATAGVILDDVVEAAVDSAAEGVSGVIIDGVIGAAVDAAAVVVAITAK